MEQLVLGLLKYGVVGLVAALAIFGYLSERKDNKELRQAAVDSEKAHAEALRVQGEKYAKEAREQEAAHGKAFKDQADLYAKTLDAVRQAQETNLLGVTENFAAQVKEADEKHHEQEDELVERLVTASETYADKNSQLMEKNGQLTEKVAVLVDSMNRRGR